MGEIRKYADEMGTSVLLYTPSFIQIGSGTQQSGGGDTRTDSKALGYAYF